MPDFVTETATPEEKEEEEEDIINSEGDEKASLMKLLHLPYTTITKRFDRAALDLKQTIVKEKWELKACDSASPGSGYVTFIIGRAGGCALGAVATKHNGDEKLINYFLKQFKEIILGSSSIPRRQILAEMGYEFTIVTADIDEKAIRKEKPEELVMALAEAKAEAIISKLQTADYKENDDEPILLITADQVVVYEGTIREKPSSKEEARHFIKDYSGEYAATVGSVLVTNLKTGTRKGGWDRAEIYFHDIPDEVIDNLIAEGVVLNVAGGVILEHPLISPFVKAVVGSTDSIMGLPKALTEKLVQEAL